MARINAIKNGPYMVENLGNLETSKGEKFPKKDFFALCRCGKSKIKPFCDGTHVKVKFKDNKRKNRVHSKLKNYTGKEITIHDNRGICAHRGHCTDFSPKVFRPNWSADNKDRWIDPNGDDFETTIKTIKMCPSGALSFTKDGVLHKNFNRNQKIIVTKNGPYDIEGGIEYKDSAGNKPAATEHYCLCRCGAAKNKPFCDGSHRDIEFDDESKD